MVLLKRRDFYKNWGYPCISKLHDCYLENSDYKFSNDNPVSYLEPGLRTVPPHSNFTHGAHHQLLKNLVKFQTKNFRKLKFPSDFERLVAFSYRFRAITGSCFKMWNDDEPVCMQYICITKKVTRIFVNQIVIDSELVREDP